jgi:cation:H+ antiporter
VFEIWVPLISGFALLLAGGDLLVRGAVRMAGQLGVSPLVIGLTVVGFGTSTPELVTSVQAALIGAPGIAYGNIVGSNIANMLLIVGAAALLYPMAVTSAALRRDGLFMVAVAVVFAIVAAIMPMERWIGVVFLVALGTYIYMAFRQEVQTTSPDMHRSVSENPMALQSVGTTTTAATTRLGSTLIPLVMTVGGLFGVILGGYLMVGGAVALAQSFGISETVIGLTIVAIGTSAPELITSILAAMRKQTDVAFGNIIGSNIYNILCIGGATALIAPGAVPQEIVRFDNMVMVGVSVAFIYFAWTGLRIARWEGLALLAAYAGYAYLLWP